MYSGRPQYATETSAARNDSQTIGAPQPRKPANFNSIEPRCEKCYHSEPLLRDTAFNLNKLKESLLSGPLAESFAQVSRQLLAKVTQVSYLVIERNCMLTPSKAHRENALHDQIPHVLAIHRVLDLVQEANELAKQVLQIAPSNASNVQKQSPLQANDIQTSLESMKRRFLTDTEDLQRQRRPSFDLNNSRELHDYSPRLPDPATLNGSPRRLSIAGTTNSEILPPIRSASPAHLTGDGYGGRLPSMKPPPTPARQLPSPPGRSHPSPPSYSMPSPASLYPQSVTSASCGPQSSALPNILHPISPTPSSTLGGPPTTALAAHTAALQHSVSVQKYALATLQSEHDKLLSTLRRSQTRARTLEEKAVASDLEINTLAEERVRLLTQVQELEQQVTEVGKSRDEFREAAVRGGKQYVEIVRMASRIEMLAGEERREWKRKMEENQAIIDALRKSQESQTPAAESADVIPEGQGTSDAGSGDDLRKEVQRLRSRCAEMESMLTKIRGQRARFGDAMTALNAAGERIFDTAATDTPSGTKLPP